MEPRNIKKNFTIKSVPVSVIQKFRKQARIRKVKDTEMTQADYFSLLVDNSLSNK